MGAWSHEAFGNDNALDWAHGLEDVDDLSLIEAALSAVADEPAGYLDASPATEAQAAIELVARLRGHASDEACPEVAEDWMARTRLVPPEPLVRRALAVLDRIGGSDSELKQLWDESDSAAAWQASLVDLRRRLLAPVRPLPAPLDAIGRLVKKIGRLPLDTKRFGFAQGQALMHRMDQLRPPDSKPGATVDQKAAMARGHFHAKAVQVGAMSRQHLYALLVAAEALGDSAEVRRVIAVLWQSVEGTTKLLWDLAVREAKTWAAEGRLDIALAGLAAWRVTAESLGAGTFDMRCMAVCQEAGDYGMAERLRDGLIAAGHGAPMQRVDRVLLAVRAGSVAEAQALLAADAADFDSPALQPWLAFAQGILTVRQGEPGGLALLTPWMEERVQQAATGAATWGFFGIGAGWWALALHREACRTEDARAVVAAMQPLLLTNQNALLVGELKAAGLLDDGAALRRPSPSPDAELPGCEADHGALRTVAIRGVNALQQVHAWRRDFLEGRSRRYPFLIGNDEDLAELLDRIEPPPDGGQATLAAADALDLSAWLAEHGPKRKPRWPSSDVAEPGGVVSSQFDTLSGQLKPLMHVGLVEVSQPSELFARLGYGDWNACPAPAVHVALQRRWAEQFGALPVAVRADVVECVLQPPGEREPLLRLSMEQHAYSPDIVEQGVGSTAKLAASLLNSPVWYFWWD